MIETDVAIGALDLANGARLEHVVQRVTQYGKPNGDRSNIVLVNHALTGSSRVAEWWSGFIGPDRWLDPARDCIIGINVLGGCYGSSGPASLAPDGAPYRERFPIISVADIVAAQRRALVQLGYEKLQLVIGGSLGGMQALQWAVDFPAHLERAVVIGAHDAFSAMGIGLNAVARAAIVDDPLFAGGAYSTDRPPLRGLRLARMIAMLTYKSDVLLETRFANRLDRAGGDPASRASDRFDIEGYLAYQGDIFAKRMDANSYLTLTRAMDLFDVRNETNVRGTTAVTFVGIENDWLFPAPYVEQAALRFAARGYSSSYAYLPTDHGHDAFLAEPEKLAQLLEKTKKLA